MAKIISYERPAPTHIDNPVGDTDRYPMMANCTVDLRLMGGTALLSPFLQYTSSQRVNMLTNNIPQHLVVFGSEPPTIASGYELEFSKYTFNTSRFPQQAKTLAVISRYRSGVGTDPIADTPKYTVLYLGLEDNKVHSLDVNKFSSLTSGFGYENHINYNKLKSDTYFEKGELLSHSNSVRDGEYNMGVNANICFMSMRSTVQDAICISESLAEKLNSYAYKTVVIPISKDQVPLNLYGDEDQYKFFPDIGELVREDSVICAFRNASKSPITDFSTNALQKYQLNHDMTVCAEHTDCEVVDVEVRINPNKKVKTPEYIFEQLAKYDEETTLYYETIEKYYNTFRKEGYEVGNSFGTLAYRAGSHLLAKNRRALGMEKKNAIKYSRKAEPIEFIELVITYRYVNEVSIGYKLVGREAGKGVVSEIRPDEDMPVNDFGVRADMIMAPEPMCNRMITGQLYEQFINVCMYFVIQKMKNMHSLEAYKYLLDFIDDVNPLYVNSVERAASYKDSERVNFVKSSLEKEMFVLVVPPYINTFSEAWALYMFDKYNVEITPVTYNLRNADGSLNRVVRTIRSHCIGKKYVYVLCKIPHVRASGITLINQFGLPVKYKGKISMYPMKTTPIRDGEDEVRLTRMLCSDGSEFSCDNVTFRLTSMYSNSLDAVLKSTEEHLTNPHPTRIDQIQMTTEELIGTNKSIQISQHMLSTVGVDAACVSVSEEEAKRITDLLYGVNHGNIKTA